MAVLATAPQAGFACFVWLIIICGKSAADDRCSGGIDRPLIVQYGCDSESSFRSCIDRQFFDDGQLLPLTDFQGSSSGAYPPVVAYPAAQAAAAMANLMPISQDLSYYAAAHQTYLSYATKAGGPVGNWSQDAFKKSVVDTLSTTMKPKGALQVLGIGSGAGDIDCAIMEMLLPYFPVIDNTIVEPSGPQLACFKARVKDRWDALHGTSFQWRQETIDEYMDQALHEADEENKPRFHLIHALHSLYYTEDLERTICTLRKSLVEGGILVMVLVSEESVFVKLAEKLRTYGADDVPATMSGQSALHILNSLRMPCRVDCGHWLVPSSPCLDEASRDGQHLLDFLTHVKAFRQTASPQLFSDVMECIKSPSISQVGADGEFYVFRDWMQIIVTN